MGCNCKNKEYHPCQNGGKCQCGGKCKKRNYSNVAGSLDDFKNEESSMGKAVLQLAGGLTLGIIAYMLYNNLK